MAEISNRGLAAAAAGAALAVALAFATSSDSSEPGEPQTVAPAQQAATR